MEKNGFCPPVNRMMYELVLHSGRIGMPGKWDVSSPLRYDIFIFLCCIFFSSTTTVLWKSPILRQTVTCLREIVGGDLPWYNDGGAVCLCWTRKRDFPVSFICAVGFCFSFFLLSTIASRLLSRLTIATDNVETQKTVRAIFRLFCFDFFCNCFPLWFCYIWL